MNWQLNRILWPVFNLGPGKRIGIWVQGCSLRCPGCLSPGLHDPSGGRAISIERLIARILPAAHRFNGITISGGEPFDQSAQLMEFCNKIHDSTSLDLYVFSGYTLETLNERFNDSLYLSGIDFLVDGRYDEEIPSAEQWRGSANQRLFKLSPEGAKRIHPEPESTPWSVGSGKDGTVFLSGIPGTGELAMMNRALKEQGIATEFI